MSSTESKLFGIEKSHILFYSAQDLFEKGLEATKKEHPATFTERPIWALSFPICTLTLSLELALKGFLSEAEINTLRRNKKGHKLIEIYRSLPPEVQEAIENHFDNCKAHKYMFFHLKLNSDPNGLRKKNVTTTNEKIKITLEKCGQPYVDFRYLHQIDERFYYFDFNTVIKLIHSCLAIQANQLGLELN